MEFTALLNHAHVATEVPMPTLSQLYEQHALACARAADLTDDPQFRCLYLKLAAEWKRDAQALQQPKLHPGDATDPQGRNTSEPLTNPTVEKTNPLFFWSDSEPRVA